MPLPPFLRSWVHLFLRLEEGRVVSSEKRANLTLAAVLPFGNGNHGRVPYVYTGAVEGLVSVPVLIV